MQPSLSDSISSVQSKNPSEDMLSSIHGTPVRKPAPPSEQRNTPKRPVNRKFVGGVTDNPLGFKFGVASLPFLERWVTTVDRYLHFLQTGVQQAQDSQTQNQVDEQENFLPQRILRLFVNQNHSDASIRVHCTSLILHFLFILWEVKMEHCRFDATTHYNIDHFLGQQVPQVSSTEISDLPVVGSIHALLYIMQLPSTTLETMQDNNNFLLSAIQLPDLISGTIVSSQQPLGSIHKSSIHILLHTISPLFVKCSTAILYHLETLLTSTQPLLYRHYMDSTAVVNPTNPEVLTSTEYTSSMFTQPRIWSTAMLSLGYIYVAIARAGQNLPGSHDFIQKTCRTLTDPMHGGKKKPGDFAFLLQHTVQLETLSILYPIFCFPALTDAVTLALSQFVLTSILEMRYYDEMQSRLKNSLVYRIVYSWYGAVQPIAIAASALTTGDRSLCANTLASVHITNVISVPDVIKEDNIVKYVDWLFQTVPTTSIVYMNTKTANIEFITLFEKGNALSALQRKCSEGVGKAAHLPSLIITLALRMIPLPAVEWISLLSYALTTKYHIPPLHYLLHIPTNATTTEDSWCTNKTVSLSVYKQLPNVATVQHLRTNIPQDVLEVIQWMYDHSYSIHTPTVLACLLPQTIVFPQITTQSQEVALMQLNNPQNSYLAKELLRVCIYIRKNVLQKTELCSPSQLETLFSSTTSKVELYTDYPAVLNVKSTTLQQLAFPRTHRHVKLFKNADMPVYFADTRYFELYHVSGLYTIYPYPVLSLEMQMTMFLAVQASLLPALEHSMKECVTQIPLIFEAPASMTEDVTFLVHRLWQVTLYTRRLILVAYKTHVAVSDVQKKAQHILSQVVSLTFDGLRYVIVEYDKLDPHAYAETLVIALLRVVSSIFSVLSLPHKKDATYLPFTQVDSAHTSVFLRLLSKQLAHSHSTATYTALSILPTFAWLPHSAEKVVEFYHTHTHALVHSHAHVRVMFAMSIYIILRDEVLLADNTNNTTNLLSMTSTKVNMLHTLQARTDSSNEHQSLFLALLLTLQGDKQREVAVFAVYSIIYLCKGMLEYTREHPVGKDHMQSFLCRLWSDLYAFHTRVLTSFNVTLDPSSISQVYTVDALQFQQAIQAIVYTWARCMHGDVYTNINQDIHSDVVYLGSIKPELSIFETMEEAAYKGKECNAAYITAGYPCQVVFSNSVRLPQTVCTAYSIANYLPIHMQRIADQYFSAQPNHHVDIDAYYTRNSENDVFLHMVYLSCQFGLSLARNDQQTDTLEEKTFSSTASFVSPCIQLLPLFAHGSVTARLSTTLLRCLQCFVHTNLTALAHVLAFINVYSNAQNNDMSMQTTPVKNALDLAATLLHLKDPHASFALLCNSNLKSNVIIGKLDSCILDRALGIFLSPQTLQSVRMSAAKCLLSGLYTAPNTCVKKGIPMQLFFKAKALLIEIPKSPYLPKTIDLGEEAITTVFLHSLPSNDTYVDTQCQILCLCVSLITKKQRKDDFDRINTSLLADINNPNATIPLLLSVFLALRHVDGTHVDNTFFMSASQSLCSFFMHANHYLRSTAVLTCGILVQHLTKQSEPLRTIETGTYDSILHSYKAALVANQDEAKDQYKDMLSERTRVFTKMYYTDKSQNTTQNTNITYLTPVSNILWFLLPLLGDTHNIVKTNALHVFLGLLEQTDLLLLDSMYLSMKYISDLAVEGEFSKTPQVSGVEYDFPIHVYTLSGPYCVAAQVYASYIRQLWQPYGEHSYVINPHSTLQPLDMHRNRVLSPSLGKHFLFPTFHWLYLSNETVQILDKVKQKLLGIFNDGFQTVQEHVHDIFTTKPMHWLIYLLCGHVLVTVEESSLAILTQNQAQLAALPHKHHADTHPCSSSLAVLVLGCISCVLHAQHTVLYGVTHELPSSITDLTRQLLSASAKHPCFMQASIAAIRTSISNNPQLVDTLSAHTTKLEGSLQESLTILHALAAHSFEAETTNSEAVISHIATTILPKIQSIQKTNFQDEHSLYQCLSLVCRLSKVAKEDVCVRIVNDILDLCRLVTVPSLYTQCISALSHLTATLPTSHALITKLHENARSDVMHPNVEIRRRAVTSVTISLQSSYNNATDALNNSGITGNVVQLLCDPDRNIIHTTVDMILNSKILQLQEDVPTPETETKTTSVNLTTSSTLPLSCMQAIHDRVIQAPHASDTLLGVHTPCSLYTPVKSPEKAAFELHYNSQKTTFSPLLIQQIRKSYIKLHPNCVENLAKALASKITTAQPSLSTLHALSIANTLNSLKMGDLGVLYKAIMQLLSNTMSNIEKQRNSINNAVKTQEHTLNQTESLEIPSLIQNIPTSILDTSNYVDSQSTSIVVVKSILLLIKNACQSIKPKLAAFITQHVLQVCMDSNAKLRQLALEVVHSLLFVNINSVLATNPEDQQISSNFGKHILLDSRSQNMGGAVDSLISTIENAFNTHQAHIIMHNSIGSIEFLSIGLLITPFISNPGFYINKTLAILFEKNISTQNLEVLLSCLLKLVLSGSRLLCHEHIYNEIVSKVQSYALCSPTQELELVCNSILHNMLILHRHYVEAE